MVFLISYVLYIMCVHAYMHACVRERCMQGVQGDFVLEQYVLHTWILSEQW